jgi:GNAT superfamily N-acetyltransferase
VDSPGSLGIIDVDDETSFQLLPPCADPRFDHRSCDYWEDDVRGSKAARESWLHARSSASPPKPTSSSDNPFAPPPTDDDFNPFAPSSEAEDAVFNPFAPQPADDAASGGSGGPRKLRLLRRGRRVFGSYAKVLLVDDEPSAYAQFGPLSAYPRAQAIRELYPRLPSAPLPAVITCIATASAARGRGHALHLVEAIARDLAARGFAAVEAYPDLTLAADEASAASPAFWEACGFSLVVPDERYPVMRRELD